MRACVLACVLSLPAYAADLPAVASGKIERIEAFASEFVPARTVDVWLPDGYADDQRRYAVLYMHDGQMLFDAKVTWNHQEWQVDEVASTLIASGELRPFIVVGVHNGGDARHSEYFPQKPFESLSKAQQEALYALSRNQAPMYARTIDSDDYLRFLVQELKPYVDAHYRVDPSPQATAVMGSSMGGLISMYALLEHPEVFGAAACLSTHWPGIFTLEDNPVPQAFLDYLDAHLPAPAAGRRIYFDHGTGTLDAMYPPLQAKVDALMRAKGYAEPQWVTRVYPGADHSEQAWAARLATPLRFLWGRPAEPEAKAAP